MNPLVRKLHLRPSMRAAFVNAPAGYLSRLEDLPDGVVVTESLDVPCDFVQLFAADSTILERDGARVVAAVKPDGVLWICYPKLSSGVRSDLTRDEGGRVVNEAGWRPVASISVDDVWSGVGFRPAEHKEEADMLEAQYSGAKAALRPIYERVLAIVQGFGDDVELQTRRTYIAFARGKQFAVVQPATRTRVDVGLKLPGAPLEGRLEPTTNTGGGSITHKVAVTSVDEVDAELAGLLRRAYDQSRP